MTRQSTIYLSTVGAVVAVIVGCGGSSATSGFAAKADAACKANNDATNAASANFVGTAQGAAQLTSQLLNAQNTMVASLKKLTPPSSAKAAYNGFIAEQQSVAADLQKGHAAALAGNPNQYRAAQHDAVAIGTAADSKAAAAGLTLCAYKLPAADVAAIKQLVIAGTVHPTVALCTTSVTQHYLTTTFHGDVAACKKQIVTNPAKSATVTRVGGILPSATVDITQVGGSQPRTELTLVKENGTWKVDTVGPQP